MYCCLWSCWLLLQHSCGCAMCVCMARTYCCRHNCSKAVSWQWLLTLALTHLIELSLRTEEPIAVCRCIPTAATDAFQYFRPDLPGGVFQYFSLPENKSEEDGFNKLMTTFTKTVDSPAKLHVSDEQRL